MTAAQHPAQTLGTGAPELVANILACHDRASESVRADGRRWYPAARDIAATLDPDAPERAAGVIAALSPQTSWSENVRLARRAYATGRADGHIRLFCARANAIKNNGETPLSVLGGKKVRSFFTLIADPYDWYTVCVDRHAVAVALGRTLSDRERKILERVGVYDYIADAYRIAAHSLGIAPHELQAITWLEWRRETAAGWSAADARVLTDQLSLEV